MLMGLAGAIVVEGPAHDARARAGIVERVLVVRQTQDQDAGKAPTRSMTAAAARAPAPARGARAVPGHAIDTAHELLRTANAGRAARGPPRVLRPAPPPGAKAALAVRAGTTEEWVIENWTNELHTFHIHQLHLRVLEVDGRREAAPPLLDVVEVPHATATGLRSREGPARPGRIRIRMTFPAALAGDIPFHCHLVDHEDNGMMAVPRIEQPGAPPRHAEAAPMAAMHHGP